MHYHNNLLLKKEITTHSPRKFCPSKGNLKKQMYHAHIEFLQSINTENPCMLGICPSYGRSRQSKTRSSRLAGLRSDSRRHERVDYERGDSRWPKLRTRPTSQADRTLDNNSNKHICKYLIMCICINTPRAIIMQESDVQSCCDCTLSVSA